MCVLPPGPTATTPEAGSWNFSRGRRAELLRNRDFLGATARGSLGARCSRPSHVGRILLTGVVVLFPEDRKTRYHWWAFRRLLGSPGHPGFLLLLGPVFFYLSLLEPRPRRCQCRTQVTLVASETVSTCPSSAAAEFDHTPSSCMILVRRLFLFIKLDCI